MPAQVHGDDAILIGEGDQLMLPLHRVSAKAMNEEQRALRR